MYRPLVGLGGGAALGWSLFGNSTPPPSEDVHRAKAPLDISWWSPDGKTIPNPTLYPTANQPSPREEVAQLTFAPHVPPPINRNYPVHLLVDMDVVVKELEIDSNHTYEFWTFNGGIPGPFIRARKGDVMSVTLANHDMSGMVHNVDFHAVQGPGGGSHVLTTESGKVKKATFKLDYPGLFIYHCAVAPVGVHMANGMYGLILVEPEHGLPKADKEFYVLQSELYCEDESTSHLLEMDIQKGLDENPTHVIFNGRDGALRDGGALHANQGDRVRFYFGNAGPNLISSFHIIGTIFDSVYREGDLVSPPARALQTTMVPAGGAAVIDLSVPVPGTFALVDHSIFRIEKGAAGWLHVDGHPRPDLYHSDEAPQVCAACKHHP